MLKRTFLFALDGPCLFLSSLCVLLVDMIGALIALVDLTERPGRGPDLAGIALGKTGKLLLPLLMS